MTIPRMVGLLVSLAAIGIAVVVVRVDQMLVMRRIQQLQFRQTDLRREIWTQEMELARLRSPRMIRERAERIGLDTGRPSGEKIAGARR
ncbi:MAG: hypothetical protein GXY55_16730 [Phycisphaerae bacterium]|nr:hypothetical protein [Phycisphaerae bacterium]